MPILVITKKTLLIALAIIVVIIAGIIILIAVKDAPAAATTGEAQVEEYELEVLAGKKRELPVYSVAREEKQIALTIDAAWEDDKTAFILDTLDTYGVKATFFLCGFWVDKYPDMVKEIYDRGHEIGNHSNTHPHMTKLSAAQMKKDVEECEKMIEKITGVRSNLFRAPYGEYNDAVILAMREAGYEVIQWDLDTVDMKWTLCAKAILPVYLNLIDKNFNR